MSSDLPRDSDLATNGDSNGTLQDTPTVAPATTAAPVSKHVENVMYSDVCCVASETRDHGLTFVDWDKHPVESSQAKHCIFARTLNLITSAVGARLNINPRTFPIS